MQSWRFTILGTISNSGTAADTFDANGDGELNLLEYATAQDPNASSRAALTAIRTAAAMDITYTRSKAAPDLTCIVEWNDTLATGSWSTSGVGSPAILSDNGVTQQIKVTVPVGSGVTKRFVHLKVTRP